MRCLKSEIPDVAIESLARSFCHEAAGYGFTQIEYVKFVNAVLDRSMQAERSGRRPDPRAPPRSPRASSVEPARAARLPVRGERVSVRAAEPEADLPLFDRWLTDNRGREFLRSRVNAQQAAIRDLVRRPENVFAIITLHDATPIGAVAFLDHDPAQRKAEMRKLIGDPAYRGKGFAKEASALWIGYGQSALGLRKIYVSTFHTDVRNVRLNQDLGFRVEGILRNEVLLDGQYHDVLRMGLWTDDRPE